MYDSLSRDSRSLTFKIWAPLALGLSCVSWPALALGQLSCPDPARLTDGLAPPLADIRYLADDDLQGREVGTPGAACAADYLVQRLEEIGIGPASPEGYFQPFTVTTGYEIGSHNRLAVGDRTYTLGEDWVPFGFSSSGELDGNLLYGGLGMSGQVLVIDAPDPHSPEAEAMESDPHFLAAAAARHGTLGVILLLADDQPLPDAARESRPTVSIPVVAVAGEARTDFREAGGSMASVEVTTDVGPSTRSARNVAALLEGTDPSLRGEVVILGAHFDHLGLGGEGSLAPDAYGIIHNGADDNASGTAALLDVATRMASSATDPARSVLFLFFTGEERGLWGANHYVKEPILPLDATVAMLNMDMVGKLGDGVLTVFGMGTAEEWEHTVSAANAALPQPLELSLLPDGFGPSDHSAFYGEGIPVLHFFTNAHEDYHRPTDDWDRIDDEGLVRVADLVTAVAWEVAGKGTTALALTPLEGAGTPHAGGVPASDTEPSSGGGYGPYLGTIPDMTPQDFGVRLTGVREESPAEQAGLQGGDVIVEFGGLEVSDLYAYTYALRERQPGDEVEIVVLRDGERISLTAVLGRRR